MLFSERPAWIARNPALRRIAVETWRSVLRLQRATLAKAVLVVKDKDGRILVTRTPSGALQLPAKVLDAQLPVTTQAEEVFEQVLHYRFTPSLVAIEGTPSAEGVTFLFAATFNPSAEGRDGIWLQPDVAAATLDDNDNRLLRRCTSYAMGCEGA